MTRDRTKIYVYCFFQIIGMYYWWRVWKTHLVNTFFLSFGRSNGYMVMSIGAPEGSLGRLSKLAMYCSIANMVNCAMGTFGSLHVVTSPSASATGDGGKEPTVVVVQGTEVGNPVGKAGEGED